MQLIILRNGQRTHLLFFLTFTGWSIISRLSILGFHGPKSDVSEQIRCFLEAPRVNNLSDIVLFVRDPARGPSKIFLFLDPYFKIPNFGPQKAYLKNSYSFMYHCFGEYSGNFRSLILLV